MQEYKARDKTVRKMSRDGLTEENLHSGETVRVSHREREERILPKQAEDIPFSPAEKAPEQTAEGRKRRQKLMDQPETGQGEASPHAVGIISPSQLFPNDFPTSPSNAYFASSRFCWFGFLEKQIFSRTISDVNDASKHFTYALFCGCILPYS